MHPFDKITSDSNEAFPFKEFLQYPHCMGIDWKEEEPQIVQQFLRAADLPKDAIEIAWSDVGQRWTIARDDRRYAITKTASGSLQYATLCILQEIFKESHSIHYLNHVAPGDTGYFVVETNSTWAQLERANALVRWFFTPIQLLPDTFITGFEKLSEIGKSYGVPREFVHLSTNTGLTTKQTPTLSCTDYLNACRARFDDERAKSPAVPFVAQLKRPSWLKNIPQHPLNMQYDQQPILYKHGRVVWAHIVQANKMLFSPGELDHPAAVIYGMDTHYDEFPSALGQIASHLYAQKNRDDPDPEVAEFARVITNEHEMPFNVPVPRSRTDHREVFFTSVVLQRSHMPNYVLSHSLMPFIVAPKETRATMLLPFRYWPYNFW